MSHVDRLDGALIDTRISGGAMRFRVWMVLLALLTSPAMAEDQAAAMKRSALAELAGTLSVAAQPTMSEGKLTGCSLVFEHLQQDFVYLNGDFIRSSGSLAIVATDAGGLGVLMKVVAMHFNPTTDPLSVTPLQVSRVYLVMDDLTSNYDTLAASGPSEAEGGLVAAYPADPSLELALSEISSAELTVAVGLSGSSDIQLPIDLTVIETNDDGSRQRSSTTSMAFLKCAEALLQRLSP